MLERNALYISIIIYLIIAGSLIYFKPSFLFTDNRKNKLRQFGTGKSKNKSIFPFWFILFIIGILIYFIVCAIVGRVNYYQNEF